VGYQPVVDIRAIKKDQDPEVIIPEILKYQVKEADLVADKEWFLELTRRTTSILGNYEDFWSVSESDCGG
jgi:hypothetical protein